MPKRNKLPNIDYEGGVSYDKAIIQKANPLLTLSQTDLSLVELKILDAYLSRINSRRSSMRTVHFEKGALEEFLGVSKILKSDLEERLKNLFKVVEVKDTRKKEGFKLVSLFEKAEVEQGEDGLWEVTLTCSASAREYVFNIESIGYFRYFLSEILNLKSRYSYVLFLYIRRFRNFSTWTVGLEELKEILSCTATTYDQYKRFNDLILKKCHKEITEKTNLKYTYTPIKKGRSVVSIKFTVDMLPDIQLPEDIEQLSISDSDDEREPSWVFEHFPWLTDAQGEEVRALAVQVDLPNVSESPYIRYYHYMMQIKARLNRAKEVAEKKGTPIKNEYAYLIKIIENDMKG